MTYRVLLLLLVFQFLSSESALSQRSKPAAEPSPATIVPTATVAVSFGRQSLREADSVPVEVWISNASDQKLQNVKLEISSPKFMHWHEKACDQPEIPNGLVDAQISPHKTEHHKLCVSTDNEIEVGDVNIVFSVTYEWDVQGVVRQSFVTSEKTIKVNLFGSESVAGIPLGLAGFILPGLIFWIVVHLWKVPWNQELSKELIYSVLISVLVIGFGYLLQQKLPPWRWLKYLDIRNGISIAKLFALAAAGIIFGNIVGAAYRGWLRWKLAQVIHPEDDLMTKVEKIVKQNQKYARPKTTVKVTGGSDFVGSLAATADGTVWLAGWFKINIGPHAKDTTFVKKIRNCSANLDDAGTLRLARSKGIKLEDASLISESATGKPQSTLMNWKLTQTTGEPQAEEDPSGSRLVDIVVE